MLGVLQKHGMLDSGFSDRVNNLEIFEGDKMHFTLMGRAIALGSADNINVIYSMCPGLPPRIACRQGSAMFNPAELAIRLKDNLDWSAKMRCIKAIYEHDEESVVSEVPHAVLRCKSVSDLKKFLDIVGQEVVQQTKPGQDSLVLHVMAHGRADVLELLFSEGLVARFVVLDHGGEEQYTAAGACAVLQEKKKVKEILTVIFKHEGIEGFTRGSKPQFYSALHLAAIQGDVEMVEALHELAGSGLLQTKCAETAMYVAVQHKKKKVVEVMKRLVVPPARALSCFSSSECASTYPRLPGVAHRPCTLQT